MAIRIPFRVLAFALYTLVLLGAAFGISYGVFEWRHDEPTTGSARCRAEGSSVTRVTGLMLAATLSVSLFQRAQMGSASRR
jgi:hypothetical protein